MNKVKIPDSLSASGWEPVKKTIANDKALSKVDTGKMTSAVNALESACKEAYKELEGLADTKGLTAANAAAAIDKFATAASAAIKAISSAATGAGTAASNVVAAVDKAAGKSPPKETASVVTKVKNTLASGTRDATAFASAISSAVAAAQKELEDAGKAIANKAVDKKPANAPVKGNAKAQADAKFLSALMRKQIALLRTPKGPPMPVKFMVLFNKANPRDLRLYLGPRPETSLGKLKSQFPSDVKVNRVRDPKGQVVWEKGALTFLSDILKSGLARQVQLAIKALTKVNVKVRIKRSNGDVDEADAKDVSDEELAVSPAEEAEMNAGGSDWKRVLDGLAEDIKTASNGANGDAIKKLVKEIQANGEGGKFDAAGAGIEKLELMLAEGDVADSDGNDLQADPKANKDAIADLKSRLNDVTTKVAATKSLKKEAATLIGNLQKAGLAELGKTNPVVDNAKKALDKIEQMLDAAAVSTFPVAAVEKARKDWVDKRAAAIKGITELSKKINEAFKTEAGQKDAVVKALTQLGKLQIKLQTGLDNDLNLAIKAKDPEKQANMLDRARDSLSSLQDMLKNDEVLQNIDNHDVPGMPSLSVVGNMMKSLDNLEKALPR
jgi:hypothetical protein